MKCRQCKRKFPDGLIQSMCVNGDYVDCCPICALRIRNELHGLPRNTLFGGSLAQSLYKQAVEHLKQTKQGTEGVV